jgi:phage-related protein
VTDGIRKWVADNRASIDQFVANLRTAFDNLTGAVVAIIDFLKAAWANGGQEMLTIVFNTINNIVNIIAGALQIIQGIFQVATGALTGNWSLLWDGLRNIAAGAGRLLANAIDAVMRIIVAQWGGNWDQIKATTSAKLAQMVGAVSSGLATIASFFGSLPGRILGAVGNLGGLLVGAGRAVIQGFLNGINSMIGAVTAKLRQLTSMIPQLKGPPSRDARLLYSNGQRIMDGLLAGFSSRIPAVDATLSRITNVVIPGAATAPGPAAMATTAAATPAVIDVHVHVGDEVVRTVRTVLDDINRGVRRRITAGTGQGI